MIEEDEKITAKVVLEIMGSPKEHVENTMSAVQERVKAVKEVKILKESLSPPVEVEPKPFWSSYCEFELEFKDEHSLFGFCFDFMPSSIDILSPKKFSFTKDVYENMLNDLLARLHQYDMVLKNIHAQNIILKKEIEKGYVDEAQPEPSDLVEEDKKD